MIYLLTYLQQISSSSYLHDIKPEKNTKVSNYFSTNKLFIPLMFTHTVMVKTKQTFINYIGQL